MRKSVGVVHCLALCLDCGKEFTCYKNAQALGAMHAKKYGHKVTVEVGLAVTYNGRLK